MKINTSEIVTIFAACALLLWAIAADGQESGPDDPSIRVAHFGMYPLSPGVTVSNVATKADVCVDKFARQPVLPISEVDEMFTRYQYPQRERKNYTVCLVIPYGLGGALVSKNLVPLANDEIYGPSQKIHLDTELRKDVCKKGADLNRTRSLVAQDWVKGVGMFVAKFGLK